MADRQFPVRPNLEQLKHQAKDLLRAMRGDDPSAKLAEAQLALARSYGLPSWPRLVLACKMTDAIWRDDADAVRDLVLKHPRLLHENARGVESNWGPPMSYAANLGRDRIIAMLRGLGATDLQHAFDRACLQGRIDTARQLYAMGARLEPGLVMGPTETLNSQGLQFLIDLGAEIADLAPVAQVLQTYSRNPQGKHRCLEIFAENGIDLPDTPTMAVHRGRIDLLEEHLRRDPGLLSRTFSHEEIYPPELGCDADHSLALHGTPLAGTALLHLCVDNDEIEIARWLIARGADVNGKAAIDDHGFGGHTALFGCVVSQPFRVGLRQDDGFARLLLDHGADPNVRASLRKRLRFVEDETVHEYRDVTPLAWGERFHDRAWVNEAAMRLISQRMRASGPSGLT
ncbi:MAG TPA: ankyrin repeat domain-containing protein [Thermoanaerobaculia bacterium]|nr:ankyrin repeat domain-containing protein [Thermoanaerobaculia bacterium]